MEEEEEGLVRHAGQHQIFFGCNLVFGFLQDALDY